jgi:hypothetical protein
MTAAFSICCSSFHFKAHLQLHKDFTPACLNREWLTKQDDTDLAAWAELMNRNLDIRRQLYGDAAIGEVNLDMVNTARRFHAGAKLAGSGGAVLVCITGGEQQAAKLIGVTTEHFCSAARMFCCCLLECA